MILILLLSIEGRTYLLYKLGKLKLIDKDRLVAIVNSTPKEDSKPKPMYIPHPYFGYVYTPNNRFFQKTYMESNSEGFIDEEFPLEKREGFCIYGLLGGSAAMSWGIEKREERIHYQLETLLNAYARETRSNKRYRVLNMGVGSYIQYQATQVFLYYKNLLDGVIIYSGHNEVAHGIILTRDVPVQYPWIDLLAVLEIESSLKYEIFYMRDKLNKYANFLLKKPYLLYSPFLRFFFTRVVENELKRIDELNNQLKEEADRHTFNMPRIKGRLHYSLPTFNSNQYLYQDDPESIALQKKVMRAIVPLIYTDPIIDVYMVARVRGVHFLNIIQPMMLTVDRKMTPEDLENTKAPPVYEKTGLEILREEAKKMKAYGVETHDLNDGSWFKDNENAVFIDPTHLTAEGNKIVASYLFKLIKEKWLNK